MLEIFNNLEPFFQDNYREIHVREYAKLKTISPPTAAKLLATYEQEGLLTKTIEKKHYLYQAKKDSELFINLQQSYWQEQLKPLLNYLEKQSVLPTILLFGSIAHANFNEYSDIDIALITVSEKELNLEKFEQELDREIHLLKFSSFEKIPKLLRNNILNGKLLRGSW